MGSQQRVFGDRQVLEIATTRHLWQFIEFGLSNAIPVTMQIWKGRRGRIVQGRVYTRRETRVCAREQVTSAACNNSGLSLALSLSLSRCLAQLYSLFELAFTYTLFYPTLRWVSPYICAYPCNLFLSRINCMRLLLFSTFDSPFPSLKRCAYIYCL